MPKFYPFLDYSTNQAWEEPEDGTRSASHGNKLLARLPLFGIVADVSGCKTSQALKRSALQCLSRQGLPADVIRGGGCSGMHMQFLQHCPRTAFLSLEFAQQSLADCGII
jgi:hypothetical protein